MDINDLRAEVRRRQKAANNKIARLRRKGVMLGGTEFDVRRDVNAIGRYNRNQLNSYLNTLNSFVSRNNAFVPGAEGTPLRRSTWNQAQRIERQLQAKVQGHYESVKGTFIPRFGTDVEGFQNTMQGRDPRGAKAPLDFTPLHSTGITSEKHLQKLNQDKLKKLDPNYLPKALKKNRYQVMQSLTAYGDPVRVVDGETVSLNELASQLSDEQLDTLWNYTDAPRELFSDYHYLKLLSESRADEGLANIHDEAADDAWDWIIWARNLPPRQKK